MRPIPFSSFGGYRPFTSLWWRDLWRTVAFGWWHDVVTYWHRARHGWAPRDTWNLSYYLDGVLAGALTYLADHAHGAPFGYGHPVGDRATLDPNDEASTNQALWDGDLRRWARAFALAADDTDLYDDPQWSHLTHTERWAECARRLQARSAAFVELLPYWSDLWD